LESTKSALTVNEAKELIESVFELEVNSNLMFSAFNIESVVSFVNNESLGRFIAKESKLNSNSPVPPLLFTVLSLPHPVN
jgi:hypothetical protein